jgi:deoxyadenosine/deoxycytidine kinase
METFSALAGKSIGIAAPIGGGKTTCIGAIEQILTESEFKVLCEPEFVPPTLLKSFYTNPKFYARDFQTHMHAHAAIRDKHARAFVTKKEGRRVALVERPLAENFVFFESNIKTGSISADYRQPYVDLWEDFKQFSPDLIVYLHVNNEHAIERIIKRSNEDVDRKCEKDGINVDYMDLLAHEYFDFIKLSYTDPTRPPVLVIDWNEHVDVANKTVYHEAVKRILRKANDYFSGAYKLPNFVTHAEDCLSVSTGDLMFRRSLKQKQDLLTALAAGQLQMT